LTFFDLTVKLSLIVFAPRAWGSTVTARAPEASGCIGSAWVFRAERQATAVGGGGLPLVSLRKGD
jgi:hypothetical protein